MLKIRKPCQRRKRQPPAEKPRGFEHEIDAPGTEFGRGRAIDPERKRRHEAGTTTIERRRLHDFNAGNARQSREFQRVVIDPRKHHGPDFSGAMPA